MMGTCPVAGATWGKAGRRLRVWDRQTDLQVLGAEEEEEQRRKRAAGGALRPREVR